MSWKIVASAAAFALMWSGPCGGAEKTLKEYTDQLLNDHGPDAIVDDAAIKGRENAGNGPEFEEEYHGSAVPFDRRIYSTTPSTQTPCADDKVIIGVSSGPYYYEWCPASYDYGGYHYEAQRDFYRYQSGRLRYSSTQFFDCDNANDKAAMPTQVKTAVCPP